MELLNKALEKKSATEWSKDYNINPSTIACAKRTRRLSPLLAANLAIDLGADAKHWATIAAIESERDSPLKERLRKKLGRVKSVNRP